MKALDILTRLENQNTPLPVDKEEDYKLWQMQNMSISDILRGLLTDYDYQGAYQKGLKRDFKSGEHFTDEFKKYGHPTFSNESWNPLGLPAGTWENNVYKKPNGMLDLNTLTESLQ